MVGMLLFEHCAERTHLAPTEARAARVERTAEEQREVPMLCGDAGASGSRCGEITHDAARNGNDLAVEIDLDHLLLRHVLSITANSQD